MTYMPKRRKTIFKMAAVRHLEFVKIRTPLTAGPPAAVHADLFNLFRPSAAAHTQVGLRS